MADSDGEEWIPLRQAVVEVAKAYSEFMLCPPNECLANALTRVMSRLEREICDARAHLWDFSVEKGEITLEQYHGEKADPDSLIPGVFWKNMRLFADGGVSDWVSGEYSYRYESDEGIWGAGLAIDVEVTRHGLPLVGGEYGKEEAAIRRHAKAVSLETRGRRRKWDWEGAICHVLAVANADPDGLPSGFKAHATICKMLGQWFLDNQNGEPVPSEIGDRATRILETIDAHRK